MSQSAGPTQFITFEGGEGAGKSTQVALLAQRLLAIGFEVVVTREPGGTMFAEALRTTLLQPREVLPSPLSQALVFYAARADHLDKVILPALERGAFVICDRFADSTRVYQGAAGGLAAGELDALDNLVLGSLRPGLTLVMDLPAEIGMQRVAERRDADRDGDAIGPDMFEARALAFHEALRVGFTELTKRAPQRCRLIDARGTIDDVHEQIWKLAATAYGL